MRRDAGARDYAWGTFAVLVATLAMVSVVTCTYALIWALAHAKWLGALRVVVINLPVAVLMGWWLGAGSWRRTVWGEPSVAEKADAAAATLTARQDVHLARMTVISLLCGAVLIGALAVQAWLGSR